MAENSKHDDHIAHASSWIQAQADRVWEGLTNPEMIRQYLFGTQVVTDWKAGSPILWRGEWQGKAYEDKGRILQIVPERLIETTYWSSMGGLPDTPENYKKVRYELKPENDGTRVTVTQDNNASEEDQAHSEQNWKMVLDGLKKLVEQSRLPVGLAQPARRALANAGIVSLDQLTGFSEVEIKQLHGIGPKALDQLRKALQARGLSFAEKGKRA